MNDNVTRPDKKSKGFRKISGSDMCKRILPIVVFAILACACVFVYAICMFGRVVWISLPVYVAVGVVIAISSIIAFVRKNDKLARVTYWLCLVYLIVSPFLALVVAKNTYINAYITYITPFLSTVFVLFANGLAIKNLHYYEKNTNGIFLAIVSLILLSGSIMSLPISIKASLVSRICYIIVWIFPAMRLVFYNKNLPMRSIKAFFIINVAFTVSYYLLLIDVALYIAEMSILKIGRYSEFYLTYIEFYWKPFYSYHWYACCISSCIFELMYVSVFVLNIISARAEKKRLSV